MFSSFNEYFLFPFLRVLRSTVIYLITLNFEELKCNFTLRFPLIFKLGLNPFLRKLWLKWYLFSDEVQGYIFGVFDPASTSRRLLKNKLCPQETFVDYYENVTSLESCQKRINNH